MARHRGHNEGTISERTHIRKDGTKATRFVAQLPLDEQGKRPSLGSFKTRAEARQALKDAEVARAQGTLVLGKVPTIREWCQTWLAGRTRIAYGTRRGYEMNYHNVMPYIGHIRLDKLTEEDLAVMWSKLAAGLDPDGKTPRARGALAATTLDLLHVHLNAALRAAVRSRHIPLTYNPASAAEARPERGEREPIHPLSEDEAQRLFVATKGQREHALWVTLITTGMRHGEAQGLRWEDVDLSRGTASVRQMLHRETGKGWVAGATKTRKERMVTLRPQTVATLKAHRVRQAEKRLAVGPDWHDHGYVFTTDLGTPLDQRFIQGAFDSACRKAGIERRKVKETRHTYATLALCNGVHPKVVQEALGHSSIAITLDIYSHLVPGLQQEAMSHLDRLFS